MHQADSGFFPVVGGWNHVIISQCFVLDQERVDFLNLKLSSIFFFSPSAESLSVLFQMSSEH